MARDYRQLSQSVRNQLNPENYSFDRTFSTELSTINYSDVLTFVRLAMKGVEPEYTQRSKEAGQKVKDHLSGGINDVTYEYQGSIMTNTHVKGFSDIDLLVISKKFYTYDHNNVKSLLESPYDRIRYNSFALSSLQKEHDISAYTGNATEDLQKIRVDSENILKGVYDECDIKKPKAIRIRNKSLKRDVDIVIANWYDDVTSIINGKGEYRGIQVYNKDTLTRETPDYPFLSIKRINERSSETSGRLKRMIRFLKNIRNFSQSDIKLSSFDINAICYDIDVTSYKYAAFHELVPVLYSQLYSLCNDLSHSNRLMSVDGREHIFRYNQEKIENVRLLMNEVQGVFVSLKNDVYA